ncbi:putative sensor signal transduction histidine kinase [Cupriavidus taiwanensis]|uniref:sensor histidine kinase n=1 Tax=Cupriavidus taiwanensis TaxID=164546 RepID=UPI000E14E104|nr:HAMP domain-containing sensor histidine kinase [Cupriavidus taiwanensis]SOZ17755.1 putative sensor signal transduction histidine kinase [Cupriavidus taiwanensis]SOZ30341.1 putative sensor signal transduction histidine kinase [Cupriavidus taiwanensis]SOZ49609.1 putative sensor signal transduction histidine kinase [Cupriavidus taiwanensis]
MNGRARKGLAWPRTLFARLMVILLVGLVMAQSLSYSLVMMERKSAADRLMLGNLERDVASSVAMLDMLPADQRAAWLERVRRENYSYRLDAGTPGEPPRAPLARRAVDTIAEALQGRYPVSASSQPGGGFQVHLRLRDGSPLTIDVQPKRSLVSPWLLAMLAAQLALLVACAWLAVRVVTRPLSQLASAAENLGPDLKAQRVPETGPTEVAHAAAAFNAMQARIAGYLDERMQILAAISHDLQTPITRMRLRVDLMEDSPTQQKLYHDLREMEHLVREGVAYARTLQGGTETPARIDPDALLDSLAGDYLDAGHAIAIEGHAGAPLLTRPQALRRILTNLIDNALKFGAEVTLAVARQDDGWLQIAVQDRGPGIPEAELERVMQPYYRVETSRNRGTGGTGLGLAIALQLTQALGGTLQLANREGGGLQATLRLPA